MAKSSTLINNFFRISIQTKFQWCMARIRTDTEICSLSLESCYAVNCVCVMVSLGFQICSVSWSLTIAFHLPPQCSVSKSYPSWSAPGHKKGKTSELPFKFPSPFNPASILRHNNVTLMRPASCCAMHRAPGWLVCQAQDELSLLHTHVLTLLSNTALNKVQLNTPKWKPSLEEHCK